MQEKITLSRSSKESRVRSRAELDLRERHSERQSPYHPGRAQTQAHRDIQLLLDLLDCALTELQLTQARAERWQREWKQISEVPLPFENG